MADVYDLARQINARRKQASQGYSTGWDNLPLQAMEIIQTREKQKKVDRREEANFLSEMFGSIDSPDGLAKWKDNVSDLRQRAGDDKNLELVLDMFDSKSSDWSDNYNKFKTAVDKGSEFINSDKFIDTEDEFVDLIQASKKANYESPMDFLMYEKERVASIADDLSVGISNKMKYKGKEKGVVRKLEQYNDRLDIAIRALGADNIITPEEAQLIMIGDATHYGKMRTEGKNAAEFMIKDAMSKSEYSDKTMDWIDKKEINNLLSNKNELEGIGININSYIQEDESGNIKDIDWESLRLQVGKEKSLWNTQAQIANEKYKNWTGRYFYEGFGEINPNDMPSFSDDETTDLSNNVDSSNTIETFVEGENEELQESIGEPVVQSKEEKLAIKKQNDLKTLQTKNKKLYQKADNFWNRNDAHFAKLYPEISNYISVDDANKLSYRDKEYYKALTVTGGYVPQDMANFTDDVYQDGWMNKKGYNSILNYRGFRSSKGTQGELKHEDAINKIKSWESKTDFNVDKLADIASTKKGKYNVKNALRKYLRANKDSMWAARKGFQGFFGRVPKFLDESKAIDSKKYKEDIKTWLETPFDLAHLDEIEEFYKFVEWAQANGELGGKKPKIDEDTRLMKKYNLSEDEYNDLMVEYGDSDIASKDKFLSHTLTGAK